MRAKEWFRPATAVLLGAVFAAGCAMPSDAPQGIAEAGDGAFTLSTRGPTAAAAVERGLNQASQHCADQNRMISVQSTRIERDGYNIAFRCLTVPGAPGGTRMAAAAPAAQTPVAAAAAPVTAEPVAAAPVTAAPVTAEPLAAAAPVTAAPVTAEPFAAPAPVMAEPAPPSAPAPVAAAPAPAPSLPPAAAPAARPVTPGGAPLPTASSPLPPIAGTGSPGVFSRPTPSVTPSSFWQAGR